MSKTKDVVKKTILLTLTIRCNLNCVYCYECMKDSKKMSFDTAKSIIEKELGKEQDEIYLIEFHGGEPFLNFELLQAVCEWFWNTYPEINVKFFVTTNGTRITAEAKEWLLQNKHRITVALSLDGTPEMNMSNRGCRISDEILKFVHENWPIQNIKMTLSHETLPLLCQGVVYAHQLGFPVSVNMAYGVDWKDDEVEIYKRELLKLVDYYIEHPEIEKCSIFTKSLIPVLKPYEIRRHCQAGKKFRAYDVDGNYFPCHAFSPNTLQVEEWNKISSRDFANDDSLYEDPSCRNCEIQNICPTCYGMNFIERGHPGKRDKRFCKFVLQEKLALCELKKREILNKEIEDITKLEYLELKAVQKIEDAGINLCICKEGETVNNA